MVEPQGYPPNAIKNARERERNTTANDIVKWHFWQFQTTQQFPHTRFFASSRGKNKRKSKQCFFKF
jgi:hypothetical protein